MSDSNPVSASDVLHSIKLYTSPMGLIGRYVEFTVEGRTCAGIIIGCEISEFELVLTLGLRTYMHHAVRALVYSVQERSWSLHLEKSTEKTVDTIRFSGT